MTGSAFLWVGLALLGLVVPIANRLVRRPEPALPVLGTVPAFNLVDQSGRAFGSRDLDGVVWLAGFIFTRCPTICPTITRTMGGIQQRARGLEPHFRLVSFSVDPSFDQPEVLAAYARKYKVSPRAWSLLTGPLDAIEATVVAGLKIAMGAPPADTDFASIFHGTHFVLVDGQQRIRGYYDSSARDVADRVLHDAAMLINRGN